ncbi:MAG: tetratricopeptide repeat protein [Pirellulales bacterium]|nr:tetratricopeptide repeat protein [Pirellulales bacterium]
MTEHSFPRNRFLVCPLLWGSGLLLLGLCQPGCLLWRERTPVPADVASCRQLSQRGLYALQKGDVDVAERFLRRAVQTNPRDPQAQHYHSELLWMQGDKIGSLSAAEQARALAPEDPQLLAHVAEKYLELEQLAEAKQLADEAVDLCPQCVAAWTVRARANQASGQWESARADYERALQLSPRNPTLLLELADVHRQLNRPLRALAVLGTLRETYPPGEETSELLTREAAAYAALDRLPDAILAQRQAVERQPLPAAFEQLAAYQRAAGDEAGAVASLAQARHTPANLFAPPPAAAIAESNPAATLR